MYTLSAHSAFAIPNSYIYDIRALAGGGVAAIASDDTLRLLDPSAFGTWSGGSVFQSAGPALSAGEAWRVRGVHAGVTCLEAMGEALVTAGRDGMVGVWDVREGKSIGGASVDQNAPILSLATSAPSFSIAAGTELTNHQASVVIWDTRNLSIPRVQYIESHSDDITELQFHPTAPQMLCSGSTDGLLNIYNTTITDEEDALHQTIPHNASIHRATFLSATSIAALSHDEKFAIYQLVTELSEQSSGTTSSTDAPPQDFGDVRELLGCEYSCNVIPRPGGGAVMAVGKHAEAVFEIVQLRQGERGWVFEGEQRVGLDGAHGSEVVRAVAFLDPVQAVVTAGEDGLVKVWRGD